MPRKAFFFFFSHRTTALHKIWGFSPFPLEMRNIFLSSFLQILQSFNRAQLFTTVILYSRVFLIFTLKSIIFSVSEKRKFCLTLACLSHNMIFIYWLKFKFMHYRVSRKQLRHINVSYIVWAIKEWVHYKGSFQRLQRLCIFHKHPFEWKKFWKKSFFLGNYIANNAMQFKQTGRINWDLFKVKAV